MPMRFIIRRSSFADGQHARPADAVALEVLQRPIGVGQRIDGRVRADGDGGRLGQQLRGRPRGCCR